MSILEDIDIDKIKQTLKDPISFFKVVTGFPQAFEYQKHILLDNSKRLSVRSGRQVGKSEVIAVKVLHYALWHRDIEILILAPSQRQSEIIFRKIKGYLTNLGRYFPLNKLVLRETSEQIYLYGGVDIYCLPSGEGDTVRGYSPSLLVIDEAAFLKDRVFTAIDPSIANTNGTQILISTPFGKRGRFYETFAKPEMNFNTYHIKSEQCPNIREEFLAEKRAGIPQTEFMREYEGEFLEELDTYFPFSLIQDSISTHSEWNMPEPAVEGYTYFLGVDCARFGLDETVYCIIALDRDKKATIVKLIATSKKPTTDIVGRIIELHEKWNFRWIMIDETGLGGGVVDFTNALFRSTPAKGRIRGVVFKPKIKAEMYDYFKLLMEQKRLKLLFNERCFRQMQDLQVEYKVDKKKIHAPDGGHDDYTDAIALACYGVKLYADKMPPSALGKITSPVAKFDKEKVFYELLGYRKKRAFVGVHENPNFSKEIGIDK